MDFVIFGVGTGAALVLIGWLGRDLGPRLRHRAPRPDDEVLGVEELVARVSWARFCGSAGAALALCGALLLLVTFATLVLRLSDDAGTTTMLATFAVVLVAMAVWSWAYVRRFGVYGVLAPRRPRAQPVAAAQPRPAPAITMTANEVSVAPESMVAAAPDVAVGQAGEAAVSPEPVEVTASEELVDGAVPDEAAIVATSTEIAGVEPDTPPDTLETSTPETEREVEPEAQGDESEREAEIDTDAAQAAPSGDSIADGSNNEAPTLSQATIEPAPSQAATEPESSAQQRGIQRRRLGQRQRHRVQAGGE